MLPIMMTIILGCVDFGRFAYLYIAVTNAARAGADYGIMRPTPTSPGALPAWEQGCTDTIVDELMGNTGLTRTETEAKVVVPSPVFDPALNQPAALRKVQVQVSYPFQTLVNWPGIPRQMMLTRSVDMRIIR